MRATLNGVEIEYQDGGQGSPLLLGHGYSATGRMWDGQRAALGKSYRIVSWDMRGHGQSESPADPAQYSTALTVADMDALLRHCGIEHAVVGGLSLGGYMSLAFYRAHPNLVRALVICDSGPGYRNPEARAAWNTRAHERAAELESKGLDALAGRSREMREAMGHHRSAQGLAHAARGMLAQQDSDVIDSLPSIRVPTLVVVGERDQPFLAPCQYMAKKIPGARLEVIPDAGHSSNLDQPAVFNGVLASFLESLEDRPTRDRRAGRRGR
jgi:pimeloyl-ACP methyl ester carboxylesterase